MFHRQNGRGPGRWLVLTVVASLTLGAVLAQPARAAEADKAAGSLKLVPADAAFYSTMLRNREQWEAITKSRAWAKLKALPMVQMAWQKIQSELDKPGGPLAQFRKLYEQEENKELINLVSDAVSQEIFLYGGESVAGFAELLVQAASGARFGPAFAQLSGQGRGIPPEQLQLKILFQVLAQSLDLIRAPDLVIGFKLSDSKRAEAQLKRLEALLQGLAEQIPLLKGRVQRQKAGKGDFLTLTLDGSLVPWDQIPIKDLEDNPGQYDALMKKLKGLRLTISLGTRENYLLLSLGASTAALAKFGQGESIANRPELKPLAKFADQRLTSIDYVSKDMMARVSTSAKDIDGMVEMAKGFLAMAELTDEQRQRVEKDLQALAKDIKGLLPKAGAQMSFSFLTERGHETYSYDWGEHRDADGSKPLTLLNHVGGNPLVAAVGRSKYSPEQYQRLVKWIKIANKHFEDIALPKLDEVTREKYAEVAKVAHPLLRRLDEVTGKMLLPALADGQLAFVLDAKLTSKQWHPLMPESDKPLPMLEPAVVLGVSDAELLRKALGEYRSIANELIAKLRQQAPGQIPEFEIAAPKSRKLKSGTLYYYELPELLGLDRQIAPTAGLSDTVAALAISQSHAERLLAKHALKTDGGPHANLNRPLASAGYLDWPGVVDALTPWLEMGVKMLPPLPILSEKISENGNGAQGGQEDLLKQVRTVLQVLKVLRSYSSASYFENGALVTHSETVFRDI